MTVDRATAARRLDMIIFASEWLKKLADDVCPACKAGEIFFCEIVDGVHAHAQSGDCPASPILQLLSHVDDIRHQFANEFNPEEKMQIFWTIVNRFDPRFPEHWR